MKKINRISFITSLTALTAITPTIAITSCSKEAQWTVTVIGADYVQSESKLELNKESTIVLKAPSGYRVSKIKTVQVGETILTTDKYEFSVSLQTLVIKATAMESKIIYIEVSTEEELVKWSDGWYAYDKENKGGTLYTKGVNVDFNLKTEPTTDEELTFSVETTKTSGDNVTLVYETLSRTGKKVLIPFRLKTSYSYIEFGSYAYYGITFTCTNKKTGVVSWSYKISDCYLFLLFALKNPQASADSYATGSGKADVEAQTTVNVPHKKFDDKELTLKAEIVDTTERPGSSKANIVILDGQSAPYKSDQTLYQLVKISDTTGLTAGDKFKFTIKFTITLNLFPEKPIDFIFEGVTLTYK